MAARPVSTAVTPSADERVKLAEAQIALFNAAPKQSEWERIALALKEKLPDIFRDSNVLIIPFPLEAPAEFPRLVVDRPPYKASFSFLRADFTFTPAPTSDYDPNKLDEFKTEASKFIQALAGLVGVFSRVGCSAKIFEAMPSAPSYLTSKLTKLSSENVKEFSFTVNYRHQMSGLVWNDISVFTQATMTTNPSEEGVLVTRDLSTLIEEKLSLGVSDLDPFLEMAYNRIKNSNLWEPKAD